MRCLKQSQTTTDRRTRRGSLKPSTKLNKRWEIYFNRSFLLKDHCLSMAWASIPSYWKQVCGTNRLNPQATFRVLLKCHKTIRNGWLLHKDLQRTSRLPDAQSTSFGFCFWLVKGGASFLDQSKKKVECHSSNNRYTFDSKLDITLGVSYMLRFCFHLSTVDVLWCFVWGWLEEFRVV